LEKIDFFASIKQLDNMSLIAEKKRSREQEAEGRLGEEAVEVSGYRLPVEAETIDEAKKKLRQMEEEALAELFRSQTCAWTCPDWSDDESDEGRADWMGKWGNK
jgi:hypothetical protein